MTNEWFPKDDIGPRSFVGRTAARDIRGPDLWLRKNRFDATGLNRGGKLETRVKKQELNPGYLVYGHVAGQPLIRTDASIRAFGPYRDRGGFVSDSGFSPASSINLSYYGRGYGSTLTLGPNMSLNDFNNKSSTYNDLYQWITRNGTKFERLYNTYINNPATLVHGYDNGLFTTGAARVGRDWVYASTGGVQIDQSVGSQYRFFYIIDLGAGGQFLGNTVNLNYQLNFNFWPVRVGPTTLIANAQYLRPEYSQSGVPHAIDVANCPGLEFQFSFDNGFNWVAASSANILSDFMTTVKVLDPTNTGYAAIFNDLVSSVSFRVCAVAANIAIVKMVVPYLEVTAGTATNPISYNKKAKVKLGVVNIAGRTVTETAVLYDGEYKRAFMYGNGSMVSAFDGVVFETHPVTDPTDGRVDPVVYCWTRDGVDILYGIPTGIPAWKTGQIFALTPNKVACVFWDGKYSMYQSTNRGQTWQRKGTVSADGVTPTLVTGVNFLINFNDVTKLYENGANAYAYAGAPWIGDSRIAPPIL